jgi:endonuclease YncB( thermonuclease family)
MAKHWKPPGNRSRFSRGELRLTLLAGLLLGLVYVQASDSGWKNVGSIPEPDFSALPTPDPYAESRYSRAVLRDQENGPIPPTLPIGPDIATGPVGRGDTVDVIDGDTFRFEGEKIRIADIDTPEVNGRCAEESALAARATNRLAVLLAAGPFELETIGGRDEDRYGRKLRIVTRNGRSIGDQLVAEGLARTWSGRREPWCT